MFDTVTLITQTKGTDGLGQKTFFDTSESEILCEVKSITRNEWAAAYQSGYEAEIMLDVFFADYTGQRLCLFCGKRFVIYRTFRKGERMELYLGVKVGELHGTG